MTATMTKIATISAAEAAACDPLTVDLIDVRTPLEYRLVHATPARLVPLNRLEPKAVTTGKPIYLLCKSGKRARLAAEKFIAEGSENVAVIEGGTEAWVAAGLPVVRGKGVISLERQVRIAAGLLVLTGVALSLTVHPWLIGLSAFVGAGLTFAGITDWCGMGMLLGRMPWNQGGCEMNNGQ